MNADGFAIKAEGSVSDRSRNSSMLGSSVCHDASVTYVCYFFQGVGAKLASHWTTTMFSSLVRAKLM